MIVIPDEERWAEALAIEKLKGSAAAAYIAERIAALTAAGDAAGVARFRLIDGCYRQLVAGART